MTDTNLPENNNNPLNTQDDEQFDVIEEHDNTWIATGPMERLPTEVYCGNYLEPAVRSQILQAELCNRDISFVPLKMEQQMLSNIS
jgi:hypothetical protein